VLIENFLIARGIKPPAERSNIYKINYMNLENTQSYYYNYVHFVVKLSIYNVKNNNYPVEYWKKRLKESLLLRDRIAVKLLYKVCQPGTQLNLFG
jgi:hypothetical protein